MRSPSIVVDSVFIHRSLQMLVTKYELMIEAFITNRTYPSFCDRIGLRSFYWSADLSYLE